MGGILFGYDIGIISGALLQLEEEWGLSHIQQELVVSLMLVGAIMGSLTGKCIKRWNKHIFFTVYLYCFFCYIAHIFTLLLYTCTLFKGGYIIDYFGRRRSIMGNAGG